MKKGKNRPRATPTGAARPQSVPYVATFIRKGTPTGMTHPGFSFRTSSRCFTSKCLDGPSYYRVPFINNVGKFTTHTLYVWRTTPDKMVASLHSTVVSKLRRLMKKRGLVNKNGRLSDSLLAACDKAAAIYAISHDDWFMDRFLGMTRKGHFKAERVHGLIQYCLCRMDDTPRFVYGQLFLQRRWLKYHGLYPCDKSKLSLVSEHVLNLFANQPIARILKARVDFRSLATVDQNPLGRFKDIKSPKIDNSQPRLRFKRYTGKPLPSLGKFDLD